MFRQNGLEVVSALLNHLEVDVRMIEIVTIFAAIDMLWYAGCVDSNASGT
jgi:hypothetical protein